MREELYQWVKNLAVFYILLSAAVHLVPDGKYEKYVRLFMGFLLIFMMGTPLFSLMGKSRNLAESFRTHFHEEDRLREQEEFANLQEIYLEKGYEKEMEKKISNFLAKRGIVSQEVKVNIEREKMFTVIFMEKAPTELEERGIRDGLLEEYEIREGEYEIRISEPGDREVGDFSSAGVDFVSGSASGVP